MTPAKMRSGLAVIQAGDVGNPPRSPPAATVKILNIKNILSKYKYLSLF